MWAQREFPHATAEDPAAIARVADEIFHSLRDQRLVEIKRTLVGGDYLFALTAEGSKLAAAKSETCRYAGPVPVSLRHYAQVVQAQRRTARTTPQQLRDALADLVIADRTIDQLGTAILSHRPLFIYGPAGNGKTSIMERLPRIYDDSVLIPHAVLRDHARITSHLAAGHVAHALLRAASTLSRNHSLSIMPIHPQTEQLASRVDARV